MIRKVLPIAWVSGVASVALTFVAVYGSWAVAYAQLGRRPLPMVDDPASIGGLATDVHLFCLWVIRVLAVVWFVSTVLTIATGVSSKTEQRGAGWLGFASVLGLLLLFVGIRLPSNAIGWFVD